LRERGATYADKYTIHSAMSFFSRISLSLFANLNAFAHVRFNTGRVCITVLSPVAEDFIAANSENQS